jgi:hypothetical protein
MTDAELRQYYEEKYFFHVPSQNNLSVKKTVTLKPKEFLSRACVKQTNKGRFVKATYQHNCALKFETAKSFF